MQYSIHIGNVYTQFMTIICGTQAGSSPSAMCATGPKMRGCAKTANYTQNGPGNVLYQWFETNGAFSNGCFRTFLAAALTFLATALNAPCALHWKTPSHFLGPAPRAGFEPPWGKQNAKASLTPCGHMHAYHLSRRKQKREGIADMGDLLQGNMAPQGKQKREGIAAPRVLALWWVIRGSNPGPWD